jgi:hypothetical protein
MAGYVRGGLTSSHRKYLHLCIGTSKCMFERQSSAFLFIQGLHLHVTVKNMYNMHDRDKVFFTFHEKNKNTF